MNFVLRRKQKWIIWDYGKRIARFGKVNTAKRVDLSKGFVTILCFYL